MDNNSTKEEALSLFELGQMYYNGKGVEKDFQKAKNYFELSAAEGYGLAQLWAGYMYYKGLGGIQDYQKAKEYFELSLEKDISGANNWLGLIYYNGYGVEKDYQKAIEYFKLAASKNHRESQYYLGRMYELGQVVSQDYQKAWTYYKLSAAKDYIYSYEALGFLYQKGKGVIQNHKIAFDFFEISAKKGLVESIFQIGLCYFYGEGVNEDYSKAASYLKRATELGHDKAEGYLAGCYLAGPRNMVDYKKAYYHIKAAIKKEDGFAWALLGKMYENGDYVRKNTVLAMKCFKRAFELGDIYTAIDLGDKYYNRKLFKNYKKAFYYYEMAVNDYDYCQYMLGSMYQKGKGVRKDYQKAIEYYEMAANNGNKDAINCLGHIYEEGIGVPRDLDKAKIYYNCLSSKTDNVRNNNSNLDYSVTVRNILKSDKDISNLKIEKLKEIENKYLNAKKFMAEGYYDESIINVRHILEIVINEVLYDNMQCEDVKDTFEKIKTLSAYNVIDNNMAAVFHQLRKKCNMGAHSNDGKKLSNGDMVDVIPMVDKIIQFYKNYIYEHARKV